MQATAEQLKKCMAILSNVVKSSSSIPVLEYVMVSNEGFEATNLSHSIIIRDIFSGMFKVDFKECLVTFSDLKKAIASAPKNAEIELINAESDNTLVLKFGNSRVAIGTLADGSEFPEFPQLGNVLAEVEKVMFDEVAEMLPKFTLDDAMRPVMGAVHFNGAEFAATDAHKMARFRVTELDNPKSSINISPLAMQIVSNGNHQDVIIGENYLACGNITVIFQSIEGVYPDYQAVIPKNQPIGVKVDRKEVLSAVKVALSTANGHSNLGKFTFFHDKLVVKSDDIDYSKSSTTEIDCSCNAEITIGYNLQMLEVILNSLQDDIVIFEMSAPNRATTFPFENGELLIMPVIIPK